MDVFENRQVVLPPGAGNYTTLRAAKGQVIFHRRPGRSSGERTSPIMSHALEKRKEEITLEDADCFEISTD
jgi:hypothetical protein